MVQKNNKNEKVSSKYLPTKFMLTARVLVGGYLLYTSYSLIEGVTAGEGRDKYFLGAFMVAFTIIGILLILFAGRDLLAGKYVGGALDAGEEEGEDADGGEPEAETRSVQEIQEKEIQLTEDVPENNKK